MEQIRIAGERAAALTRQLLAFSRKQVLQPRTLDLNALVAGLDKMLRRLLPEDILTRCSPALGTIKADPGQLEQVILNLVLNARDAMPDGGQLTIETMNAELTEECARDHSEVVPGPHVLLAVTDSGVGMGKETLGRLFEPFFTTKAPGKGTGLGLATVYGIVKQSGGHISVYSEPGNGTVFKVYLPRVQEAAEPLLATGAKISASPRGHETILLAEDDDMVRGLAKTILEAAGYKVIEASSGAVALAAAERHAGPIDLLLTDIVMPEMGGRQLAEQLQKARPAVRILYMSGYTENGIVHQGVLDSGTNFLQKPFTPSRLARDVRAALDAPPRSVR